MATVANTPVITRTPTPESGLRLLCHLVPGQQVTVGEGPCGPQTLRPLLSEQLSEACLLGGGDPLAPSPRGQGCCTLHLCQARLDPTCSLLLDFDPDLSAPLVSLRLCHAGPGHLTWPSLPRTHLLQKTFSWSNNNMSASNPPR